MAPLLDVGLPLLLLLAGVVLMVMEAMAPGAHFIVVGIALLLAGLVGVLFPPLAGPLALAVMVVLFGAAAFWGFREFDIYDGSGTATTSDSDSLAGQMGTVTETVTPREGMVKLDDGGFDPNYRAESVQGEIPEGSRVIVVDPGGGNVLTVESLEGDDIDDIDRELEHERRRRAADAERSDPDEVGTDGGGDSEADRELDHA